MKVTFRKAFVLASTVCLTTYVNVKAQSTTSGAAGNNYLSTSFLGWGTTSGDLQFRVNNVTKMLLQNTTGFVGIGTTSPAQKLSVIGDIGWGGSGTSGFLKIDQGGSIELGGSNSVNPVTNGTPYLDFHFGNGLAQDYNMRILNNANNRLDFTKSDGMTVMTLNNANVGIGTVAPLQKLHVVGNVLINGPTSSLFFGEGATANAEWATEYEPLPASGGLNFWKPFGSNNFGNYFLFLKDNGNVGINTNNPTARFTVNGNVLIGDATTNLPAGYKLYVQTGILTEKVKIAVVNQADWSDYVFAKEYKLKTIDELEAFVKEHKHLPNIPSAEEVVKDGIDMAKMDAKLLEKIEELSLYIIQLKKENVELVKRVEKVENK